MVVALVALLALSGCTRREVAGPSDGTAVASIPVGRSDATITVDGRARTYHVYRPAGGLPAAGAPLVVMLHGGFGSGSEAERYYGWDAQADRDGFVVAYPDGLNHAWNVGGGCCGKPAQQGVDDVAFVVAMVAAIEQGLPIDPRRVYVTGISNGGMLAYRLACDTSLFAAAGPDSATLLGSCPSPHPLSVIHLHGTADTRIRYDGGQGDGAAKIDGPPVPDVVASWRSVDGCAAPTTSTDGAVTTSVASCPDGRAVELITIAGAGHQWPGAPQRPELEKLLGLDAPSTALDATGTIWQFFAAHPAA